MHADSVRIFKSDVFSMANAKILTVQNALQWVLLITNTIKQSPDVHSLLCLSPVTRYVAKTTGDAGWSIAIVISITLPAHALYHDT